MPPARSFLSGPGVTPGPFLAAVCIYQRLSDPFHFVILYTNDEVFFTGCFAVFRC